MSLSLSLSLVWRQSVRKSGARRGVYRRGGGAEVGPAAPSASIHPLAPCIYCVFLSSVFSTLHTVMGVWHRTGETRQSGSHRGGLHSSEAATLFMISLLFRFGFAFLCLFLFCNCLNMTVNVKAHVGGKREPTSYNFSLTPRTN